MDIPVFAIAFFAAMYTVGVLVTYHPLAYLWGKFWGRTQVRHQSTQPMQRQFGLKEGQTIVGVSDTTKAICFYIDTDVMDEKNSE
jgi:hypothetical protein